MKRIVRLNILRILLALAILGNRLTTWAVLNMPAIEHTMDVHEWETLLYHLSELDRDFEEAVLDSRNTIKKLKVRRN